MSHSAREMQVRIGDLLIANRHIEDAWRYAIREPRTGDALAPVFRDLKRAIGTCIADLATTLEELPSQ